MELHEQLYALVMRVGRDVLDDAEGFRGALDDFLDEDAASSGDINLLVDAIRLGAFRSLVSMLESGAPAAGAVEAAGAQLARERGSADLDGPRWACAVLGYAIGRVGHADVVRFRTQSRPYGGTSAPPAPWTVAGATQAAVSPPPPVVATQRPRRRAVLLGALGLLLVAGGIVGGALLVGGGGPPDDQQAVDPPATAPTSQDTTAQPVDDPSQAPRPKSPGSSPGQDPTSGGVPAPVPATCWNGARKPDESDCPELRGYAALRWLFPGYDLDRCEPLRGPGRIFFQCTDDAGDLIYNISQWQSYELGVEHYDRTPGGPSEPAYGRREVWVGDDRSAENDKAAIMYIGERFGVTIYGSTITERNARAKDLDMRSVRDLQALK